MKRKKTPFLLLSILLSLSITITAFAAGVEYSISAINVTLTIPEDLNSLTRNVSEGNSALEVLNAKPEELLAVYQQKGIYLDVFPDDLSFEIVLVATRVEDNDFQLLSESELQEYTDTLTKEYDTMENETLLSVSQYTGNNIPYLVTSSVFQDSSFSSHAIKYYTVKNGIGYHYILQTNQSELTDDHIKIIQDILDSAKYQELKSSVTESPFFTYVMETIIGGGITILILVLILFFLNRSTRHKIQ